jgi:GNAT superfamily N-acetyltransferase
MLYKLKWGDLREASAVIAAAFASDPLWGAIFAGDERVAARMRAMAEVSLRVGFRYGEVYAPTPALQGVIALVDGAGADINPWRILMSGGLWAALRMGKEAGRLMQPVFEPLMRDRHAAMAGRRYDYVLIVGVAPSFQGRGLGGVLIEVAKERARRCGAALYLETETEANVRFYERLGFQLIRQVTLPILAIPMWELVWEPTS